MDVIAKIDELGKPAWITLMVLGFIVFWPIGLALLAYLIWSDRMGCGYKRKHKRGRWTWERSEEAQSGNRAFDEYRAETLRRLEEEQKEFKTFLDQLRFAKDKAEFDEFMAERRRRSAEAGPATGGDGPTPSVPPQPGPA